MTVLIVTAVGLLFGTGALLLFKYQCQQRIDRQHELEKVYAVRSALNYIRRESIAYPGEELGYQTSSGRNLSVIVKPAKAIFPTNNWDQVKEPAAGEKNIEQRQFVMQWGDFNVPQGNRSRIGAYNRELDYEYGAEGVTNLSTTMRGSYVLSSTKSESMKGLVFDYSAATGEVVKCWVNIGMGGTEGWLKEEYGSRYCFNPRNLKESDIVRLWLIRAPEYAVDKSDGRSYGWPPANEERSLVLELRNRCEMRLWEYKGILPEKSLCSCRAMDSGALATVEHAMGIQLAHNKASLFFISNKTTIKVKNVDVFLRGFQFSDVATLSSSTYEHFAAGCTRNPETLKIEHAPGLRAVFEIEFDPRQTAEVPRILQDFKVTPGYQYDIFVKYPDGDPILATVAQRMGEYMYGSDLVYSILTYDAHGTDYKGFRLDEQEAR